MVGRDIRLQRCEDSIKILMSNNSAVFFTLTTPDVVSHPEIRERWRNLRHHLVRSLKPVEYVMNYELHPRGHGWHIHSVWNRFIPLKEFLPYARRCGFGRVDVRRVQSVDIADYLVKHCLKAYRGKVKHDLRVQRLRLVNQSRGLPSLSDYDWKYPSKDDFKRLCRLAVKDLGQSYFKEICCAARLCLSLGRKSKFDLMQVLTEINSDGGLTLDFNSDYFKINNKVTQFHLNL